MLSETVFSNFLDLGNRFHCLAFETESREMVEMNSLAIKAQYTVVECFVVFTVCRYLA